MTLKARTSSTDLRRHIGVLYGGRSGEHEISLQSARNILQLIDRKQYVIHPMGITRDGQLASARDSVEMLPGLPWSGILEGRRPSEPADLLNWSAPLRKTAGSDRRIRLDVAFPVLHGPFGEDGTIQGLLEVSDIPYVGSGVLSSALGMDKWISRQLLKASGLPVVDTFLVERCRWQSNPAGIIRQIKKTIGVPCFVKPSRLGSSIGISKVGTTGDSLRKAINLASQYDYRVLVEKAVPARELEVSVLGNADPIASVVGEVIPAGEFYDYQSKYFDAHTKAIVPAQIPKAIAARARRMALQTFRVLDCNGLARVDFFLDRHTHQLFISELNTMPGFTPTSMYNRLWQAGGFSEGEIVNRLIRLAIEWRELSARRIY